jgi:SAM-dependent methyltransferase
MHDPKTVEYFNRYGTEYGLERMRHVVSVLQAEGRPERSLVDIGCGAGNILEFLGKTTPLKSFAGIDPSINYLNRTRERNACATYLGSILDPGFVSSIPERFDYALLGSVLHHLVGGTRRRSRKLALAAMRHSLELLKPGGTLLVVDLAFSPSFLMGILFHTKRLFSAFTPERVSLGSTWQNIGPPVVSYYTAGQLVRMARSLDGAVLEGIDIRETKVRHFPLNLLRRADITLVIRKRPDRE